MVGARFKLGEVLRSLEEWENLENLAHESLRLNKFNPLFLAEAYGFLTEVCLHNSRYEEALQWLNLAFEPPKPPFLRGASDTSPFSEEDERETSEVGFPLSEEDEREASEAGFPFSKEDEGEASEMGFPLSKGDGRGIKSAI